MGLDAGALAVILAVAPGQQTAPAPRVPARTEAAAIAALSSSDVETRRDAAQTLGTLGRRSEAAVAPLVAALDDSAEIVRATAAGALGMLGDPDAVGPLV